MSPSLPLWGCAVNSGYVSKAITPMPSRSNSTRRSRSAASTAGNSDGAGCLVIVVVVAGIWYWFVHRPARLDVPETYAEQIAQLDATQQQLNNLRRFIESQREALVEQNDTLHRLRSQSEQLRPIVEADDKVVQAVFSAQFRSQASRIWLERIISFIIGIASSMLGSMILSRLRRMRSSATSSGDDETRINNSNT